MFLLVLRASLPVSARRLLPSSLWALFLLLALLLPPQLWAQSSVSTPLAASWPSTELTGGQVPVKAIKVGYLLDASGKLDIMEVLQRSDFRPLDPYHTFVLGRDGAAWLRLRVQVPLEQQGATAAQASRGSDFTPWILELPAPLLDEVQLYQMGPDGRLQAAQKAGDLLNNAQWSYPSNVSTFQLNLYAGEVNDLWLRVKYPIATQLPVLLKTERQYLHDSRGYFWAMGGVFGTLFFLCLYVGIMALAFKDLAHLGFGLYLGTSLATLFAYSGINGYLLFDHSARWIDASTGVWQLLSAAAAVFFTGTLLQAATRAPRLAWLMRGIGAFCLLALPLYFMLDRASIGSTMVLLALAASYLASASMGIIAWRAGDSTGRSISLFYGLLALNLLATVLGTLGWLHFFWYQQTPVYVLMILALPLILAAMNFKMRHQLAMQIRAQGIRSHDALTDTLNEPFFVARLRTIMQTPRKRKHAALVLIDVSNLAFMRENFAPDIIEQTLLRAVIKIKRIFGDMDAIGRIGDNRLAVLIEGSERERVGKLAVELIASGLMPSKHLKQDITIIFHFAVAMLEDYEGPVDELLPALQTLCDKMSPRTQRPIRYLGDAAGSRPGPSKFSPEGAPSSLMPHSSYAPASSSFSPSHNHPFGASLQASQNSPSSGHSSGSSGTAAPSSSFHR